MVVFYYIAEPTYNTMQDNNSTINDVPRYMQVVMTYVSDGQNEEAKTLLKFIYYIEEQKEFIKILDYYIEDLDSLILVLTSGIVLWNDDSLFLDDRTVDNL